MGKGEFVLMQYEEGAWCCSRRGFGLGLDGMVVWECQRGHDAFNITLGCFIELKSVYHGWSLCDAGAHHNTYLAECALVCTSAAVDWARTCTETVFVMA